MFGSFAFIAGMPRHKVCRSAIRLLAAVAMIGVVSACSHTIPLNPVVAEKAAPPQLAEDVGVYFSDEFRTFEFRGNRGGDSWIFPLGQASVPLLAKAFDQVFRRTERVQSLPPFGPEHTDLAAVIEPRIEEFDFDIPFLKTQTYTASITYRFILHAANGEPVASWAVTGEGAVPGQLGFEFARWPGLAADAAMENAAQKFSSGILNVPEVRRWLLDRGQLISQYERRI